MIDKNSAEYAELKAFVDSALTPYITIDREKALEFIPAAIYTFLDRTHRDKIELNHFGVIAQLVEYYHNRQGTLGSTSENHSGVSFSYTEDLPLELLNRIKGFRKLP